MIKREFVHCLRGIKGITCGPMHVLFLMCDILWKVSCLTKGWQIFKQCVSDTEKGKSMLYQVYCVVKVHSFRKNLVKYRQKIQHTDLYCQVNAPPPFSKERNNFTARNISFTFETTKQFHCSKHNSIC